MLAIVLVPGIAHAQVVGDCQTYVDRADPGAVRQLTWDFSVVNDAARCMQIRAGQSVTWVGDFEVHPLGNRGGDSPNPIALHANGVVTFNAPGTFGYTCLAHSSMRGAIKVLAAPSVPALPPVYSALLGAGLLAVSALTLRRR